MLSDKEMLSKEKTWTMLTVKEVAEILHIHNNTVRRWADQGLIKSYRIASRGDRRFKREDIAIFLAQFNEDGFGNLKPDADR
jgi:excisionase family DNA binding protein